MKMPHDSNFEIIDWSMKINNDCKVSVQSLALFDWNKTRHDFAESIKDWDPEKEWPHESHRLEFGNFHRDMHKNMESSSLSKVFGRR